MCFYCISVGFDVDDNIAPIESRKIEGEVKFRDRVGLRGE